MTQDLMQPARGNRISRATLTEQLEIAMRSDILDGVYSPQQRLRASDLAERYGVSATPLREALQRLAAENLVELDPRLGAYVSRVSDADMRDTYELLSVIAGMALDRSVRNGDAAWDQAVRDRFGKMVAATQLAEASSQTEDGDRPKVASEAAAAHWEFHDALYQRSGSPWLIKVAKMLHTHAERYRRLSMQTSRDRRDLPRAHALIMDAAMARDAESAVQALHDHFTGTIELLSDLSTSDAPQTDAQQPDE